VGIRDQVFSRGHRVRATSRSRHVLGIAVGEKCLCVGQIGVAGALPAAAPVIFTFPPGISLDQPRELGLALRQFLAHHQLDARHAILGVPSRWLICKPVNIPPADTATAQELLWIQATATVPSDLGTFTFDYLGEPNLSEPRDLLLLGLGAVRREQLLGMASAANLKPLAIRSTAVALAQATIAHAPRAVIITAAAEGIDVLTQHNQRTTSLRHVGPITATQPLLAQLRRILLSAAPTISSTDPLAQPVPAQTWDAIVIWDEVGLSPALWSALESIAGGISLIRAKLDWAQAAHRPPKAAKLALTPPAPPPWRWR